MMMYCYAANASIHMKQATNLHETIFNVTTTDILFLHVEYKGENLEMGPAI